MKYLVAALLSIFTFTATMTAPVSTAYAQSKKKKSSKKRKSKKSSSKNKFKMNPKYALVKALQQARQGNYTEASKTLYRLSRDPRYNKERMQIKYILGLMLFEMKLYQTAAYQFVGVVKEGNSKYIDKALDKLTLAADFLNDSTLLKYSMSKIKLNRFPEGRRDMLKYRIGEIYLQKRQFKSAAKFFSGVAEDSRMFSQAKYNEGLAYAQDGQLSQALDAFEKLTENREKYGVSDYNRVAALMGMARTFYQAKDWRKSMQYYRMIPRDTQFWHDSLFELSWAQMRGGRFRSVLSNFHTLHSTYYDTSYLPESLLLRSIVYLYICKYDEMEKTIELYNKIYTPIATGIKKYLRKRPNAMVVYNDFREFVDDYEDFSKQLEKGKYKFPIMVGRKIFKEGDIQAAATYLNRLEREWKTYEDQPSSWKTSKVGRYSSKTLRKRLDAAKKRYGVLVKKHLRKINGELDDITEQAEFAKFEMTNSQKEHIKSKIVAKTEKTLDEGASRDFYIQNGYEYWPFQGEYWLDEIGNYHYLGVSSCNN